jgi:hypothetical protein
MNILSKNCVICGASYFKPYTYSSKNWILRKYCSKNCQHKGLIGNIAWNKGKPAPWAKNLPQQFKKGHPKPKNAYAWGANELHPDWKGEDVGYHGIHKWVIRKLGTPKKCELCKTIKAKKYEWASKDHKYSRNLDDWMRLCTSCHRKFDIKNNGYKVKGIYGRN